MSVAAFLILFFLAFSVLSNSSIGFPSRENREQRSVFVDLASPWLRGPESDGRRPTSVFFQKLGGGICMGESAGGWQNAASVSPVNQPRSSPYLTIIRLDK